MNDVAKLNAPEGWRRELDSMRGEWVALFPSQQHLDRFKRVVATAISMSPDLLGADRRSLWGAATMAAQDGLMPDGREGAMVIYNVNVKKRKNDPDNWVKMVRWMPMIAGILKKVRASGEIRDISVRVVRDRDEFDYRLGDEEKILHRPFLDDDPGDLRFAYSIVRTKDGGTYREVMSRAQIDKVKGSSKSQNGPWKDWYEEMAQKTVLRKQSKLLPMGHELEEMFRREEDQTAAIMEAAPLIALPRKHAALAKRDGDFDRMHQQIDACETMEALERWWNTHEAEIDALPNEHWQVALRDRYELRQERLADDLKAELDKQRQASGEMFPGDRKFSSP